MQRTTFRDRLVAALFFLALTTLILNSGPRAVARKKWACMHGDSHGPCMEIKLEELQSQVLLLQQKLSSARSANFALRANEVFYQLVGLMEGVAFVALTMWSINVWKLKKDAERLMDGIAFRRTALQREIDAWTRQKEEKEAAQRPAPSYPDLTTKYSKLFQNMLSVTAELTEARVVIESMREKVKNADEDKEAAVAETEQMWMREIRYEREKSKDLWEETLKLRRRIFFLEDNRLDVESFRQSLTEQLESAKKKVTELADELELRDFLGPDLCQCGTNDGNATGSSGGGFHTSVSVSPSPWSGFMMSPGAGPSPTPLVSPSVCPAGLPAAGLVGGFGSPVCVAAGSYGGDGFQRSRKKRTFASAGGP